MNSELSPKFLSGIKVNKDGELVGSALTSEQAFGDIYTKLQEVIETIVEELRGGVADAKPLDYKGTSPCEYCDMRPICRRDDR